MTLMQCLVGESSLPVEFAQWRRRSQTKSREGHAYSRRQTRTGRQVRQSKKYQVWRLSHRYEAGIAARLICCFPLDSDEVVIALFAGEQRWKGMSMTKTKRTAPAGFVDGTDFIDELLNEPGMDTAVASVEHDCAEMDRIYAQGLAEIRKAAALTQTELAKNMGIQQGAVSRIETREDVLVSILAEDAAAAGAVEARIVFHINGVDVELPLDRYRAHQDSPLSASAIAAETRPSAASGRAPS